MQRINEPLERRNGVPVEGRSAQDLIGENRLADFPFFAGMSEQQLGELVKYATVRRIKPNATYFDAGDQAQHFYILVDGFIRIVRSTADGEQVVVLHISPGEVFGIAKAFEADIYQATAKAASEGLALSWPSELWDQFIRDYPGFSSATRTAIGVRVEEMQEKIVEMATQRVEQRIAQAIRRLLKQTGKQTAHGIEIGFPITRQDISEMTGTTLHSVSRYMSQWQRDGIIQSERRRVVVCDPELLPV